MSARPAKLARVQSLRDKLPFLSQRALGAVFQVAASEELPLADRNDVRAARDQVVAERTLYGQVHQTIMVPTVEGGEMPIEIQHPAAMLYEVCRRSAAFAALTKGSLAQGACTPARPWHIALYADEIAPGNQLAYRNERKLWAVYWTLLEWGTWVWCHEDAMMGNPPPSSRLFEAALWISKGFRVFWGIVYV